MEEGRGRFEAIPCRMSGIAAVNAASAHSFPPHMHDEYGIGLIRRGAQKSRSGRGIVEAAAGEIITCNPGEVHDGHPIGGGSRAWTMLYFDPRLVEAAAADIRKGKGGSYEFELPRLRSGRTAERFRRLFAAVTRGEDAEPGWAEEALLKLLGDLIGPSAAALPAAPAAIRRARSRIDDAPAAPMSLADLASEAGLSRFQLLRAFEKATGLTPHAYLVQRRLHRVRKLIEQRVPLAEAAAASGFADQSHMTRLFVRTYGVSPGAYRRALA